MNFSVFKDSHRTFTGEFEMTTVLMSSGPKIERERGKSKYKASDGQGKKEEKDNESEKKKEK